MTTSGPSSDDELRQHVQRVLLNTDVLWYGPTGEHCEADLVYRLRDQAWDACTRDHWAELRPEQRTALVAELDRWVAYLHKRDTMTSSPTKGTS